jgi:uncharacterized protein (DUF362 family)
MLIRRRFPTVAAAMRLGLCSNLEDLDFPLLQPENLKVLDWKLPESMMAIDFGMPRVVKSAFKHLISGLSRKVQHQGFALAKREGIKFLFYS